MGGDPHIVRRVVGEANGVAFLDRDGARFKAVVSVGDEMLEAGALFKLLSRLVGEWGDAGSADARLA
jgi:hypothetical protein